MDLLFNLYEFFCFMNSNVVMVFHYNVRLCLLNGCFRLTRHTFILSSENMDRWQNSTKHLFCTWTNYPQKDFDGMKLAFAACSKNYFCWMLFVTSGLKHNYSRMTLLLLPIPASMSKLTEFPISPSSHCANWMAHEASEIAAVFQLNFIGKAVVREATYIKNQKRLSFLFKTSLK